MNTFRTLLLACLTCITAGTALARDLSAHEQLARDILKELVEIDTTHATGDTTRAAHAMANRLRDAGYPESHIRIIEPAPRKGNLIVRYPSPAPTRKPILLLAHIDVVAANPEDWTVAPFEFLERDGYYWGRGTADDKDEAAIWIANLIRWHEQGFRPNRDLIVALTADEEGGDVNGVQYLLANHRDMVDAAFVINEGGGGAMRDGKRIMNTVQAAEKVYQSYTLEVTNRGGHSSLPRADNAINQLARALVAISTHEFPVKLNPVTTALFRQSAGTLPRRAARHVNGLLKQPPEPAAVAYFAKTPAYNARLRTTCVATQLEAGHAENALPQRARAMVNCRVLPGEPVAEVAATLARVVADPAVSITPVQPARPSPPSPLTEEVMAPIMAITEAMWPGVPVVPTMSTGATDGLYFREAGIPVYGVSGLFGDMDDVRAHGRDERILIEAFFDGLEFLDKLVRAYTKSG